MNQNSSRENERVLSEIHPDIVEMGRRICRALQIRLAGVDLIAAPTVPVPAPPIEASRDTFATQLLSRNTRPGNLTGLPAISVPCGFAEGVPVGLQLLARSRSRLRAGSIRRTWAMRCEPPQQSA